jgi:hypothetical protein
MIICPACRTPHVQGTLFCEQCGTSLIGVAPVDTSATEPWTPATGTSTVVGEVLGVGGRPGVAAPAANGASAPDVPVDEIVDLDSESPGTLPLPTTLSPDTGRLVPGAAPSRLRVLVLNTGRLTDWIEEDVIQVGRLDRSAGVFPEIDLENDGGHNAGVSRRHVRILRQPDGYYVEDLGSINGTFLNRRRLSPGAPAELKDGDELRLGNIVLRVVLGGVGRS